LEHPNEECQSWVQADLNEHLNIDRSTKSKSKSVGGAIMFSLNMYKVNPWVIMEVDRPHKQSPIRPCARKQLLQHLLPLAAPHLPLL